MTDLLIKLVVAVAILLIAWFITERFSPDPLVTKIVQVVLFLIALFLIVKFLLPAVGVSF